MGDSKIEPVKIGDQHPGTTRSETDNLRTARLDNSAPLGSVGARIKAESATQTDTLVAAGTVPNTTIDFHGHPEEQGKSRTDTNVLSPTDGRHPAAKDDKQPKSGDGVAAAKNIDGQRTDDGVAPATRVASLAKDTANQLVAAGNNPEALKRIFDTAMTQFNQQSPTVRGTDFAAALEQNLRDNPNNPNLKVQFDASEGRAVGEANLSLLKDDGTGNKTLIAEGTHKFLSPSTPSEQEALAKKIAAQLPAGREQGLDTVRDVVNLADSLVLAQKNDEALKPLFESGMADFKAKHPNVPPSTFAGMLQNAFKGDRVENDLSTTFAAGEGVLDGSGSVSLVEHPGTKERQKIAEVPMSFDLRS